MTLLEERLPLSPSSSRSVVDPRSWIAVATAMFCVGWGGNEFTPLLVAYRARDGYSQIGVDVFLGAYVFGLIPGLLVASALSDRHGRRRVLVDGLAASILGSAALALGNGWGAAAIVAGRLLSGLAVGIAMAVGTSWVKELSTDATDPGTGARRSSIALTLGLGAGPGAAGVLAQWAPLPLVLPYLLQIALAVPATLVLVRFGVETRFDDAGTPLPQRLHVPKAGHRRFVRVVLPMAPWIFGSAGIAYAVIPQLVDTKLGHWALIFTTATTVATLSAGLLVQPVAKRLDSTSTARAIVVAMVLTTIGTGLAAVTAYERSIWLAGTVAVFLGASYGIAVVSGLLEVQRIAGPDELAGLTGVYYAAAYVGFLIPALLAWLARWFDYPAMLAVLAVTALCCTAATASSSRKHLPAKQPEAASRP